MGNTVSQSNKKVRQPASPTTKDNNAKHFNNLPKSVDSNKQTSGTIISQNDRQAASKREPNGETVLSQVKSITTHAAPKPLTPPPTTPSNNSALLFYYIVEAICRAISK